MGDADNEYIFGTMWEDTLNGDNGNDILYGFEGDDTIIGGYGIDRLFGDSGDDTMYLGAEVARTAIPILTAVDSYGETLAVVDASSSTNLGADYGEFASGGSGNDTIVGTNLPNTIFGGPGHDILLGY